MAFYVFSPSGYTSWMLQKHMKDANIIELLDGLFGMHEAVVPHIVKVRRARSQLLLPLKLPWPYW